LACGNPLPLPMGEVARRQARRRGLAHAHKSRRNFAFHTVLTLSGEKQRFLPGFSAVCLPPASVLSEDSLLCAALPLGEPSGGIVVWRQQAAILQEWTMCSYDGKTIVKLFNNRTIKL